MTVEDIVERLTEDERLLLLAMPLVAEMPTSAVLPSKHEALSGLAGWGLIVQRDAFWRMTDSGRVVRRECRAPEPVAEIDDE